MSEKCSVCGNPGQVSQYPGSMPFSDCWCDDCWHVEGILFNEWRRDNPKSGKPYGLVPFLTPKNIELVEHYKKLYKKEDGNDSQT